MNYNCIMIIGATATGKTSLSVELAKALNSEVINADSTQVFKELSIGTAKATEEEMQGIKHHLMSFLNPDEEFSVSEFRTQALHIMEQLLNSNRIPVVVGGTGFYLESLLNNYNYANAIKNDAIREKYNTMLEMQGKEAVYEVLKKVDPESAAKLHANDVKRVIRAIEIYEITGKTKSELNALNAMQNNDIVNSTTQNTVQFVLKPLIIGLNMPRELLYERINLRTELMLQNGLLDEVQQLKQKGYTTQLQSLKSIGYKELYDYLDGITTLEEAKETIKQNTRNYAKRQITWFKRFQNAIWFDVSTQSTKEIVKHVLQLLP